MDKPYKRYSKDKKILNTAVARAVEEKIKSGAMGFVGAKKMQEFRNRDWEENRAAYQEAFAEQARLKAKKEYGKKARKFYKNVPAKLRKEWGERMNFFRSL